PRHAGVLGADLLPHRRAHVLDLAAGLVPLRARPAVLGPGGAPHDFSSTTFRPRGPSVTVTASARMLTPRSTLARASALNSTNFPAIARSSYPSMTPMSSSRRIRGSSPSSLISVPAYLPNSTRSPAFTSSVRTLLSSVLQGPTALASASARDS